MFRGPRRPRYTVEQFAAAYEVPVERVQLWIDKGFLQCDRKRRDGITEHGRLHMERYYGPPANPKSTLP